MEHTKAVRGGTHIDERFNEEHSILIYQIYGFYDEVYYHQNLNVIRRFRSFSRVTQLEPYLIRIGIQGI